MSIEIKRIHHAGIPVSDLERSLAFFRDVLGLTPSFRIESEGAELSEAVGVEGAHSLMAMIPLPGGSAIELLQYLEPVGRPYDRGNNDVGATHICLEVANIAAARSEIARHGVEFLAEPLEARTGALAGWQFVYFKDPVDGITFELMQAPRTGSEP
jgi:catechol 2,3-dioxygenase-like lactoylglutathione lyase family enzyme